MKLLRGHRRHFRIQLIYIITLIPFFSGRTFKGTKKALSTLKDNPDSLCVYAFYPPIWVTSYLERSGFGCFGALDFERYPEYVHSFCTETLPWNNISPDTTFLSFHCGPEYNKSGFARDLEFGFLSKFRKLQTLQIFSCQIWKFSYKMFAGLSRISVIMFDNNTIVSFSQEVFQTVPNIKWLQFDNNLWMNKFSLDVFCGNPKLEFLTVRNNSISKVKNDNYKNDSCVTLRLNSLVLQGNNIQMEKGMFEYYHLNGVLNVANCSISKIDASYFTGLEELLDIDLQGNMISSVPRGVFSSMSSLIRIRLNNNKLSSIDVDDIFAGIPLQSLRLENNFISKVKGSFSNVTFLTELNLSNNTLTSIDEHHFRFMAHLKELDLSSNRITSIQTDSFVGLAQLVSLDLSSNRLKTVDLPQLRSLRHLKLNCNTLNHIQNDMLYRLASLEKLEIQKNYLSGDGMFHFSSCGLTYFDSSYNKYDTIKVTVQCLNRSADLNKNITLNASRNFLSEVHIDMPGVRQKVILSHNKLATFMDRFSFGDLRELYLRNNNIENIPCSSDFSEMNLTILDLGANIISNICKQSLNTIGYLNALYLDNNRLTDFYPVHVSKLHLAENPLKCSCENVKFKNWLMSKTSPVTDNITCVDENNSEKDIIHGIPENCNKTVSVKTILTTVLVTVAVLIAFFLITFKYRYEIQVVAFYKCNIRLGARCCKSRSPVNKTFTYDAFICFAEDDVNYVKHALLPVLEPKYKVCIYHRDFPIGEYIAESILNAIEDSAVTIVVLSRHFISSRWGRYEFRQAHDNSMRNENQKLLVIIIDKNVFELDLDLTLRSILFAKAYLKYDDYLFRQKLLHTLPEKESGNGNEACDKEPLLRHEL